MIKAVLQALWWCLIYGEEGARKRVDAKFPEA